MSGNEFPSLSSSSLFNHHFLCFISFSISFFFSLHFFISFVSSVWSTSHCQSSERAHWPHPADCSCVSSAVAGSAAGPQSPSPLARPSWCPGWTRPPEAAWEQDLISPWHLLLNRWKQMSHIQNMWAYQVKNPYWACQACKALDFSQSWMMCMEFYKERFTVWRFQKVVPP